MSSRIALIAERVDQMTEKIYLDPLKKNYPFDVLDITDDKLDQHPIWISPIDLGDSVMYEITLNAQRFNPGQLQALLDELKPPLALDSRNKVRKIGGVYSLVILTSETGRQWPSLEAILKWLSTLP